MLNNVFSSNPLYDLLVTFSSKHLALCILRFYSTIFVEDCYYCKLNKKRKTWFDIIQWVLTFLWFVNVRNILVSVILYVYFSVLHVISYLDIGVFLWKFFRLFVLLTKRKSNFKKRAPRLPYFNSDSCF